MYLCFETVGDKEDSSTLISCTHTALKAVAQSVLYLLQSKLYHICSSFILTVMVLELIYSICL